MLQSVKQWIFGSQWWQRHGKNRRETAYWRENAEKMERWYLGEQPFRLPFPDESVKVTEFELRKNAILTYIRAETELGTYLSDLVLRSDSLRGLKVADIGSGPMPTLEVFDDCERHCIDHLIDAYREIGYPLGEFEPETTFVNAKSEQLPHSDGYFDAVISRNALDHVDDFAATCREILRVLKPDGWLHVQLHYHEPTSTEPQQLNDEVVLECFGEVVGLRKIREEHGAWGFEDGATVVWSNVPAEQLAERSVDEESLRIGSIGGVFA